MLLALVLGIGQMWGEDWTSANIVNNSGAGTKKGHITVSSPGVTSTTSSQMYKPSDAVNEDAVSIATSSTVSTLEATPYIEIKADRGYRISAASFYGGAVNNNDQKIWIFCWNSIPITLQTSSNQEYTLKNQKVTSKPADQNITLTSSTRVVRIYSKIKHSSGLIGSGSGVGGGKGAIVSVSVTEALAPEIEGENQMFNDETIALTGYPAGGAWAVVSGPGEVASDGKLTANGNGTIRVSYTVDAVSTTKNITAAATKNLVWTFDTNGTLPTTAGVTVASPEGKNGGFNSDGTFKLSSNGHYAYIDLTSKNYIVTAAVLNAKTGSASKPIDFGSAASDVADGTTSNSTSTNFEDFEITPVKSSMIFSVIKNSGTSATLKTITLTVKKAVSHTLSYAISPDHDPAYATVTLGATSLIEGATTTATYSAIDAAYEFDEWQISGTDATLSSTSTNPTTITMGSADATVTLKLKAAVTKYTITYSKGAYGTGDAIPDGKKDEGVDFTLSDATYSRDGYVQTGWATEDGGAKAYELGGTYSTDADEDLFPFWTPVYTVTKGTHANGDFTISPASLVAGGTVTLDPTPADGYMFSAWEILKTSDASATGITVTNKQFEMPAYGVTIDATFVADTRKKVLYLTTTNEANTKANDKLYAALKDDYNVTIAAPASQTLTDYDLIVLHESIGGTSSAAAVTGCKTTSVPVLNTKSYFYGADKDASKRWTWGAPNAGTSVNGATLNSAYCNIASHPLFNDVTVSEGFFAITTDAAEKCMQPVGSFATGYEGYTLATTPNAATPGGTGCAIHEIPAGTTARGATSGKYLMISVSNAKLNALNANGQKLFQNAAAYLVGSTAWTPISVPTSPGVTATPSENYTEGNTITLTASATGTTASTTYTWYKGDDWATASATTPVQAAATAASDGNVFTKTAALADAGTYWCNISNGTGCDVQASVTITVVSASAPTYAITYVSDHGTAPDAANAASVVLAELSEEGWVHKGWTANVDVTVDAATVGAGTLIANGKTVILGGDVTFTAVWKEIFTVTFNSKEGSAVAGQSIEDGGHPTAVEDPTKDGYIFLGWSETDGGAVVADITALTISANKTLYAKWALNIQLTEIVFSNSFKGWINGSTVTAFYMEGESAPTIESYAGTNLKATDAVAIVGDEVVVTGSDDNEKHYALTLTAVAPLTTTGAKQTFDGSELYVKSAYGWKWHETDASKQKGWAFQKVADDGRVAKGLTREYFFFGPAESATFTWKVAKKNDGDPAVAYVYVDGVLANTVTSKTDPVVVLLKNSNSIVTFESAQTNGDCGLMDVTLAPWVPVTSVALKEGTTPISEKEIWASTSFTLTAEVNPDNASNKTITWTSSNEAIATVADGVVTGVAANASPVTITASTVDGVTATCEVTVTAAPEPCQTPTINMQPASQAYCAGSEPTLSVDASVTDGGTLHYAWFKDDVTTGSDAATCVVTGAGTYKVVVTNQKAGSLDASVTSSNAVITLNVAAAITTQPTNKSEIVSGSSVTLSLVATNATSYQWYSCDDAEKTNAAAIPSAEAADYMFTCTANGYYYCEVGNACGAAVVSNVVSVKLEPEGCNTLASIPSAEPYQYEQAGEWTLYCVSSDGTLLGSNKFTDEGKDFDGNSDVNALLDKRFAIKFAKDVESVTIYAEGGTGRTFNKVYISSEMTKNTYSELEGVTKQMVNAETNRQYILTVTGIIPADQYAWFELSGSLGVFKICYTVGLAKPVVPTLSNQELCLGENFAEIDATSTKTGDGTLSYQWYNATDEENPVAISGATDAKYTPTADGKYYVEVTNAAAGHVSNKAKSNTITVTHFAGTAISEGLVNQRGVVDAVVTLSVTASGKNLHYTWKESATIDGTYTDVAGATDAASLDVTITEGMDKYYKVIVHGDCGSDLESIAHVTQFVPVVQQNVTGSTVWDWTEAASVNEIKLTSSTTPKKNEGFVMANGAATVYNNANFESDKLYLEGEYIIRTEGGKLFQGQTIKFNTTVAGAVRVTFSHTGSNKPARELFINGVGTGTSVTGTSQTKTGLIEVPAGEVAITAFHVNPTDGAGQQYVRVYKIEFYVYDTERNDSWIAPGELGTICYPNGHVFTGAEVYEMAGVDENNKFVFDQVEQTEPGKPYLFVATSYDPIKLYKTTAAAEVSPIANNGMIGTFVSIDLDYTDERAAKWYYFSGKKFYAVSKRTDNLNVPANRAYVDMNTPVPAGAPKHGVRRITFDVQGANVATGVENAAATDKPAKMLINGQLFILRGEKMYDAKGQLVK